MLDPPNPRLWSERIRWLDDRLREAGGDRPLAVGGQTEAILQELRRVFAAGAWVTALILAQTAVDAEIAERALDAAGDGIDLNTVRFGPDYVWLRERRNAYLHNDGPAPALLASDLARDGDRLEREARRAIGLMAKALAGSA